MSHSPSNNDPHLHSQHKNVFQHLQISDPNPNPCQPNLHMMFSNPHMHNSLGVYMTTKALSTTASSGSYCISNNIVNGAGTSFSNPQQQQILDQANCVELQMGYQDAWRVCHPDYKSPFTSLEDACERLLPYHVVADYEEEEDDKILDFGEMMSCSQQWNRSISEKVVEYTTTFEKQVQEFNLIMNKRKHGDMRTEERLMIEHMLLEDEKRAMLEVRAELESRQRADQMAAMAHSQEYFPVHSDMLFEGAALGSKTSNIPIIQKVHAITSSEWSNIEKIAENGETFMWRDE